MFNTHSLPLYNSPETLNYQKWIDTATKALAVNTNGNVQSKNDSKHTPHRLQQKYMKNLNLTNYEH